ncbi:Outer membrane protein beta-barrel domain-containing protein [Alteromonadaceae bacterium Bs31]|nr:Outer membrane protein beta-barrel domain-containing protein [Alteromonadaceae bacterium Bs31]
MKGLKGRSRRRYRALIVLTGIIAASAFAQTDSKGVFRAGIDFSVANVDIKGVEDSFSSDDTSLGLGLRLGYEFPNRFGVEVGFREYEGLNIFSSLLPGTDLVLDHSVFYVLPTYSWAANNFYFRAKLGVGRWRSAYAVNIDPERNSTDRENRDESGIDPYLGMEGGLQFKHFELGLFYDYQSADFVDVKGGGLALSYRF